MSDRKQNGSDPLAILKRPMDAELNLDGQMTERMCALANHYRIAVGPDCANELALALLAKLVERRIGCDLRRHVSLTIKSTTGNDVLESLITALYPEALAVERRGEYSRSTIPDPLEWRAFGLKFIARREQETPELRAKAAAMEKWLKNPREPYERFTNKRTKIAICHAALQTDGKWGKADNRHRSSTEGFKAEGLREWLKEASPPAPVMPSQPRRKVTVSELAAIIDSTKLGDADQACDPELDEACEQALEADARACEQRRELARRTWKARPGPRRRRGPRGD